MPLDYQSDTGPKLACRFAMGEYQGKPSFLLHSPGKGFYWKNIPPDLEALIAMPNMEHSCKNFSLGPNGLFWYTYRSVKDVYEQKASTSPNLWSTLNEDWKGGCPIRLSLGPQGFWWGEKEWVDKTTNGHLVQAFGVQPQTLVAESKKKFPGIRSFEFNFVTIGVKGAWVMGTTTSDPCWNGITEQLEKTLKREMAAGHRVKNVVLCPARHDIYWIEYMDDTVDYFLPVDWDINKIATYVKTHVNTPEDLWKPWDVPKPSVTGRTQLSPVRNGSDAWKFVEKLFQDGWRHPHKQNPSPKIALIFEVVWSVSLHTSFFSYLDRIEQKGKFTVRQQIKGNQAYGWHGTRRRCLIGDDASRVNTFCTDAGCATCVILLKSFDANFAGKAPGRAFLRFGRAIYTSTVSSKADDYQSSPSNSQYKSLILARTVKGTPDTRKVGDKKLLAPTSGYDCVEGQVGQELNYDECCFYHNDAVRPAFLVLYK